MKPLSILGVLLIVLGVVSLVYQGITYTSRETVVDIGPIEATAERERTLPLPPALGIGALVAGVALVVVGGRRAGARAI
jgi:hypothetical protein